MKHHLKCIGCKSIIRQLIIRHVPLLILVILGFNGPARGTTFTTIDNPLDHFNEPTGISGNNIWGIYHDTFNWFFYNGSKFTTLNDPLATDGTSAGGMFGNSLAGVYTVNTGTKHVPNLVSHGYLFDGTTYTTFDHPLGAKGTTIGIPSGDKIPGSYTDSAGFQHGFIYDGSSFTTLDDPFGTQGNNVTQISGSNILGVYVDSSGTRHNFLYDGTSYKTLDDPSAAPGTTSIQGISGNNMVGLYTGNGSYQYGFEYNGSTYIKLPPIGTKSVPFAMSGTNIVGVYFDSSNIEHGFLFDGNKYTTIDDPLATGGLVNGGTTVKGISGNTIVGFYNTVGYESHVFIATIPEPSTVTLLWIGMLNLACLTLQKIRLGSVCQVAHN